MRDNLYITTRQQDYINFLQTQLGLNRMNYPHMRVWEAAKKIKVLKKKYDKKLIKEQQLSLLDKLFP